jgi:hypothetical protein
VDVASLQKEQTKKLLVPRVRERERKKREEKKKQPAAAAKWQTRWRHHISIPGMKKEGLSRANCAMSRTST